MAYQFKCNNNASQESDKINSFNAVYDYYYDNVIRNPNNAALNFEAPVTGTTPTWSSQYCDSAGCPSNRIYDNIHQSLFYRDTNGTLSIQNRDLAQYLNDCATKIHLDPDASTYYGNGPGEYHNTINLRDISYNSLVMDRSDLDRKMKEILAIQGSMVNEHQNFVDGSVYTTLLWTVMATSMIYYLFTKI
jgi:hypothetical protein